MNNEFISVGNTLKKIYRLYSLDVLEKLQNMGHEGLTYSYLEVISFICENEGESIKTIGSSLGLKKQTMTNHISELEKRGFIERRKNPNDARSLEIFLTEGGYNLRKHLEEVISEVEKDYENLIGGVELERLRHSLSLMESRLERRGQLF